MALISCPECGKQISDKAPACPHCGAPVSAGAPEERKCSECGSVLPDGASACPQCGCPAESEPAPAAQPVQPAQTAYTAPSVPAPSRPQLGSAKARIDEIIERRTVGTNAWLFCVTAVSVILYLIAFAKYMDFIGTIEGFTEKHKIITGLATALSDKLDDILKAISTLKWLLIGALVITALAVIFDLIRMYAKKLMYYWLYAVPALEIAGFWIPIAILVDDLKDQISGLKTDNVQNFRDYANAADEFGIYIAIASAVIAVLYIISLIVAAAVPTAAEFCPNCGRNIKRDGDGGICPGCGERKYIFGFSPVPREIVEAYPYSGETLIGMSPVRGAHVAFVILADIAFGAVAIPTLLYGGIIEESAIAAIVGFVILAAGILFTIFQIRNGARDKVTVTPEIVKLQCINTKSKLSVPISEITDVLTNEAGTLCICARGKAFFFSDISNSAQIAAALTALTSK